MKITCYQRCAIWCAQFRNFSIILQQINMLEKFIVLQILAKKYFNKKYLNKNVRDNSLLYTIILYRHDFYMDQFNTISFIGFE